MPPSFPIVSNEGFGGCNLGPEVATELSRAALPGLVNLDRSKSVFSDKGVLALIAGKLRVQRLTISNDTIGAEGMRTLAQSGWRLKRATCPVNFANSIVVGARALPKRTESRSSTNSLHASERR